MKKKLMALMLCVSMVVLTACGKGAEESRDDSQKSTQGSKTELQVVTELTGNTLDPADEWNSWFTMRWGVLETLTRFEDDGSISPWLASKWSVSDDKKTWTFTLNEGITFSDGCDVTASVVVASLERLFKECDPESGGNGNAQSYFTYTALTADDEAGTITITTPNVVVDLPGCLAYPWYGIVDTEHTEDYDTAPICTGPYVIESSDPEHEIKLVRNEHYWDGEVPFEKVSILKMAESSTRAMALQDGSADMAINISSSDQKALKENDQYVVDVTAGSRVANLFVNFDGVLGNDALRKAVLMAIDRKTVCDVTTGGSYTYTNNAALPSDYDFGYKDLTFKYEYNPDEAVKILDEAGITDSDGDGYRELDGKMIDLAYVSSSSRQMDIIAQAYAADLEKVGIKCSVTLPENATEIRSNQAFDLLYNNETSMPTGDPSNYLSHWYQNVKDNPTNYGNYHNDKYDETFKKLEEEFDIAARKKLITELQQILIDDAASIVNGAYNFNICSTTAIQGVHSYTCDYYWVTKDIKAAD